MCKAFQIYDNLSQIDDNLKKFAFQLTNFDVNIEMCKTFQIYNNLS